MTPTLMGRFQTRIFLAATVGVLWTAAITPALPRPAGMNSTFAYHVTFEALGLMTLLGLGWEVVYHLLQQARWDKDWPSVFALLVVVIEAIPLWYVTHILNVIPGTTRLSSPIIPLYVIHVGTTWLLTWLFMQGPLRVVHIRWRFEGGKVLVRAPGRLRRRGNWQSIAAEGTAQSAAAVAWTAVAMAASPGQGETTGRAERAAGPAAAEPATFAKGVPCGNGHFSHPEARYCAVCGSAVLPLTVPNRIGRRPPTGILILEDGRTTVLDHDLTVTASGSSGDLGFLPADEHPRMVAQIKLVGWQPVVISPVRTMSLLLPGGSSLRIDPGVPAPLVPGAELAIGGHRIRYESPHYGWYPSLTPTADASGPATGGDAKPGGAVARRRRLTAPVAAVAGVGTLTAVLVAAVTVGLADRIAGQHGSAGQLPTSQALTPTPEPAAPSARPSHAGKRSASRISTRAWALTASTSAPVRWRSPHPVPTSTTRQPTRPPTSPPAGTPSPTQTPTPTPTMPSPAPTPTSTPNPAPESCPVSFSLGPVTLQVCPPPQGGQAG